MDSLTAPPAAPAPAPAQAAPVAQPAAPANTFTDPRDGRTYRTVTIGGQVWMAENLNLNTDNGAEKISWCYDNNEANCEKYGRLYIWDAAMSACAGIGAGWRLPTSKDWVDLVSAAGGNVAGQNLKSTSGWNYNGNGTDQFGFSAMPGGFLAAGDVFEGMGRSGVWWSATKRDDGDAFTWTLRSGINSVLQASPHQYKHWSYSVRCVRDK
ncbi:MAG: fibrobacter succinogenes major paralogous domain-containing protein [Chitinispirillia bacterium]|nr:fibrobacter succinogenes major paralogous domain-containing protein [Chitinispirillia bacterium]